jgi:hypothetical protein
MRFPTIRSPHTNTQKTEIGKVQPRADTQQVDSTTQKHNIYARPPSMEFPCVMSILLFLDKSSLVQIKHSLCKITVSDI